MKNEIIENFLEQCRVVSKRSKCARRQFGAIIASPDGVHLSDGYNGSARGTLNCGKDVPCGKNLMNEPSYTSYEYCAAVHAEENAIINAARNGVAVKGAVLFLNSAKDGDCTRPCYKCQRAIINAGITDIYYKDSERRIHHEEISMLVHLQNEWMKARGVDIAKYDDVTFVSIGDYKKWTTT